MKILNSQYRTKSNKNSTASSRFILTDRNIKCNYRSSSIESVENRSFLINRPKFSNIQYQQELTKANQVLDSYEINSFNAFSPVEAFQAYLKYLESICLVLKNRDTVIANCFVRGIVGLRKSAKYWTEQKPEPIQSSQMIPAKTMRENLTQTYEIEQVIPDTINEDYLYIQNIADKFNRLKSEKIINRLVVLHEDLSKLYTEIPTPTETPEPVEIGMGAIGQKLNIALKLIKSEIQTNLNKVKLDKKKLNQSTQTGSNTINLALSIKEKESELQNLKRSINHYEQQVQQLSENLNKHKIHISEIETRYNEGQIELIQLKNKLTLSKDSSESLKIRLVQLSDKLLKKSKKLNDSKKTVNDLKAEISSLSSSVKHLKFETYNMTILNKIAEEKLVQIDSAWSQTTGSKFVFENVSSIEIVRKFNLYSDEGIDEIGKSPRGSDRRSQAFVLVSPRGQGRGNGVGGKEEKVAVVKSLVFKDSKISKDVVQSPLTIPQIPLIFDNKAENSQLEYCRKKSLTDNLPIIIESRTKLPEPEKLKTKISTSFENPSFTDSLNKHFHEKKPLSISFDELPEHTVNSSPRLDRRNLTKISTNLIRETNEMSSPSSTSSPSNRTRPIFVSLVHENEAIRHNAKILEGKIKNIEENSKGVQCIIDKERVKNKEPATKPGMTRASTLKVKTIDPDAFDEETLENFRRMCEQYEINDFDNMPANLKLELLKSLEGHDWKKCDHECIHLKRVSNFKYKARGIPYPIKTSNLNTKF